MCVVNFGCRLCSVNVRALLISWYQLMLFVIRVGTNKIGGLINALFLGGICLVGLLLSADGPS